MGRIWVCKAGIRSRESGSVNKAYGSETLKADVCVHEAIQKNTLPRQENFKQGKKIR
jgi:hypothetical protein